MDPYLEKILSDLGPKEKLERYHQDLAADEYLYGPTINEETEHDNPVSTLSKPGKFNSLCKDKTETVFLEKIESSPAAWKLTTQSLKVYHVSTNPPARDKKEKLCIPKRNQTKTRGFLSGGLSGIYIWRVLS